MAAALLDDIETERRNRGEKMGTSKPEVEVIPASKTEEKTLTTAPATLMVATYEHRVQQQDAIGGDDRARNNSDNTSAVCGGYKSA